MKQPTKNIVIEFNKVIKRYKLYKKDKHRLLSYIFGIKNYKIKTANDNISFKISRGESVAILGQNGAGKSTMLKMITGVVHPTTGKITVSGRVSALLELTAGFDDAFTGRENIHIKGMILGLSKSEIRKIESQVIDFADIGEYIDQPVRTHSSGMKARLGFAISAHIDPDILVIDEALSVGDKKFQEKCRKKITEIRQQEHVTVLLVTHSIESATDFCERGLVLEAGKLTFDGPIKNAVKYYNNTLK